MKRRKRKLTPGAIILPGLVLGLGFLLPYILFSKSPTLRKKMTTISKTGYDLYDLLINTGFSDTYSRFIVAQAAHESDNFTSLLFKSDNNSFGMTYQGQREATKSNKSFTDSQGRIFFYASYTHLGQAVQDYKRLFKSYGIVVLNTLESFVKLLKKMRYFEAPEAEYLKGCTWFWNLYFPRGWIREKAPGASGSW